MTLENPFDVRLAVQLDVVLCLLDVDTVEFGEDGFPSDLELLFNGIENVLSGLGSGFS